MTIDQFIAAVDNLKNSFTKTKKGDMMQKAIASIEPEYKDRIFTRGQNTSGTQSQYGNYITKEPNDYRLQGGLSWPFVRQAAGKQTSFVDLNYSGALKDSINAVKDKESGVMATKDSKNYTKAIFQEDLQSGKNKLKKTGTNPDSADIFGVTEKEQQIAQDFLEDYVDKLIEQTFPLR